MWRREEARYGRNIASCASVGVSRRWYPIWGIILVIKLVQWRWTNISIRLNYCTCVLVQLIEEMEGSYYSWCKCKKWKNCNFTKEVEGKKGKSVEHLVSRATINGSIHQRLNGTACDISRADVAVASSNNWWPTTGLISALDSNWNSSPSRINPHLEQKPVKLTRYYWMAVRSR